MEKFVKFKNRNDLLTGVLHIPENKYIASTAVILLHGWAGYRIGPHQILVQAARQFCSDGFYVLRFDFRGRGDSEGNSFEVGSTEYEAKPYLVSDAMSAIDFLITDYSIGKIILSGICNGGEVAFFTAKNKIPELDSIILWSTTTFLLDGATEYGFKRFCFYLKQYLKKLCYKNTWLKIFAFKINIKNIRETLFISKNKIRKHKENSLYIDVSQKNNLRANTKLKPQLIYAKRALIIYGETDPNTKNSAAFYKESLNKSNINFDFKIIAGADHNFSTLKHKKQVIDITSQWLISNYKIG